MARKNHLTSSPELSMISHVSASEAGVSVCFASRAGHLLYPKDTSAVGLLQTVLQKEAMSGAASKQPVLTGMRAAPFDFSAAYKFKTANVHHSTCIETTKQAIVGLGFENEATEEALDPLCDISFQDVIGDVAEDFVQVGNGYMEVVRDDGGTISGLHHIPANDVRVFVENEAYDRHYRIKPLGHHSLTTGGTVFARFGDLDGLRERLGKQLNKKRVAEVIHFRRSTAMSRWYGFPRWIAATASIELVQALHQFNFDFFVNRGVPEFMLFIRGGKVDKEDWKKIESALQAHIGLGNSHKTFALNIVNPDIEIQVERLNIEGRADANVFKDMSETLALSIVSAHGVPPLLAGILIPGKLGSTNELPNALQAFQALEVGPSQKTFTTTLGCTLGNSDGIDGLDRKAFKLNKITDEFDLGAMDTISRMRQTVPEAEAEGRDVSAGLRKESTGRQALAAILAQAIALSEQDDISGADGR